MSTIVTPIVASHFYPPAKQVLTVLPIGTTLALVPEPDNPYDPAAIRVEVDLSSTFPVAQISRLTQALEHTGYDAVELVSAAQPLHLGYLPRSGTKTALGGPGNREVAGAIASPEGDREFRVILGVAPEGHPIAIITIE